MWVRQSGFPAKEQGSDARDGNSCSRTAVHIRSPLVISAYDSKGEMLLWGPCLEKLHDHGDGPAKRATCTAHALVQLRIAIGFTEQRFGSPAHKRIEHR